MVDKLKQNITLEEEYCPWENSFFFEEEKKYSGVYCLMKVDKNNSKNNRYYFGSTINLRERCTLHFCRLKSNTHSNIFLQFSFNNNSIECFKFIIIESYKTISEDDLTKKEQLWLDCFWDKQVKCYNICKEARRSPINIDRKPMSEKEKQRLRELWSGPENPSVKNRGEKHHSFGKRGELSSNFGRKATEETKRLQSEAHKGIPQTPELIQKRANACKIKINQFNLDETFIREWDSASDVCRENINLHISGISLCLNKKRKSHGNFIWKKVES